MFLLLDATKTISPDYFKQLPLRHVQSDHVDPRNVFTGSPTLLQTACVELLDCTLWGPAHFDRELYPQFVIVCDLELAD